MLKRLNGGWQMRREWTSITKDAKNLREPQSQGIKNKVLFTKMAFHGQYLFLQVHDMSLKSKSFQQKCG
jgi:hypothetical protein